VPAGAAGRGRSTVEVAAEVAAGRTGRAEEVAGDGARAGRCTPAALCPAGLRVAPAGAECTPCICRSRMACAAASAAALACCRSAAAYAAASASASATRPSVQCSKSLLTAQDLLMSVCNASTAKFHCSNTARTRSTATCAADSAAATSMTPSLADIWTEAGGGRRKLRNPGGVQHEWARSEPAVPSSASPTVECVPTGEHKRGMQSAAPLNRTEASTQASSLSIPPSTVPLTAPTACLVADEQAREGAQGGAGTATGPQRQTEQRRRVPLRRRALRVRAGGPVPRRADYRRGR